MDRLKIDLSVWRNTLLTLNALIYSGQLTLKEIDYVRKTIELVNSTFDKDVK